MPKPATSAHSAAPPRSVTEPGSRHSANQNNPDSSSPQVARPMAESELYFSLLRVSAAQTLRAAGLTTAKPSVLDAFTDITLRYLTLLAQTTRDFAERSNRPEPILSDVRAAMEHLGLIRPLNVFHKPRHKRRKGNPGIEIAVFDGVGDVDLTGGGTDEGGSGIGGGGYGGNGFGEDEYEYEYEEDEEDTRGVDSLIEWFKGPVAAEMRRIAGMTTGTAPAEGGAGGVGTGTTTGAQAGPSTAAGTGTGPVDAMFGAGAGMGGSGEAIPAAEPVTWFQGLKNKPERWKGTALGPHVGDMPIKIEGGSLDHPLPSL
ncbi:Bromodomain associated-domain-containing protein [Kalaharituber pfeilii]|nr:Bromodomain associated-domain-containing protein [Kalaharituber pfeilii]